MEGNQFMKSWQELLTRATEWIRQHPSASRWAAVTIVVVLLLTWIAGQSTAGFDKVTLFDGRQLSSDEIGLMQVAFGKSGLNEYDIRGVQIEVPRAQRADYLKALAEHNAVPQDLMASSDKQGSFEFFQTRAQQRSRQLDRKKQTIRDMVMQLRFVDRAIVDYDETRGATPFEDMQRTAVVNVTPAGNRGLEASDVKAIRDTVRGAVAGLQAQDITIIDTYASKSHTGTMLADSDAMQPHALTKIQTERKYENKIRSALTAYPGIRVNVEVGIDPVVRRIRDERNIQGEPLVVQKSSQKETSARVPSTRPSIMQTVFGQGANSQGRVTKLENPYQRTVESTQTMANGTFETTETAGPMVTNVNVSIGVPERCVEYFVNQNTHNKKPALAELQRQRQVVFAQLRSDIQQKIQPLVPVLEDQASDEASQNIVVTLDREIQLISEPLVMETQSTVASLDNLGDYLPWLGVLAAGLLVMTFWCFGSARRKQESANVRRIIQRNTSPRQQRSLSRRVGTEPMEDQAIHNFAASPPTTRGRQAASSAADESQDTIRLQLDQWCRDNPETAAATIRQWLERKAS